MELKSRFERSNFHSGEIDPTHSRSSTYYLPDSHLNNTGTLEFFHLPSARSRIAQSHAQRAQPQICSKLILFTHSRLIGDAIITKSKPSSPYLSQPTTEANQRRNSISRHRNPKASLSTATRPRLYNYAQPSSQPHPART